MLTKLYKLFEKSKRIVFFGGAGVSTESGIPDFRSVDGLYSQKYDHPPEEILSHSFFIKNTEEFYRFYRDKMIFTGAKPNNAHIALAELEKRGKLSAVITQNIDGLHQLAGSKNVFELHGSVYRNYCMKCGRRFSIDVVIADKGVPKCPCGGIIRPDVVLYEEPLDDDTVIASVEAIRQADLLVIGGTSLAVYPAAGLIKYYRGDELVLINKTPTSADSMATLVIRESIGEVLKGFI